MLFRLIINYLISLSHAMEFFRLGAALHRGGILASRLEAPGSNPGPAKIFSLYCLVCQQF